MLILLYHMNRLLYQPQKQTAAAHLVSGAWTATFLKGGGWGILGFGLR